MELAKIKDNKYLKDTINVILTVAILVIVAIMVIAASYTYPCEDDYSWICGLKDIIKLRGGNAFTASLKGAAGYYKSNEGSFFANFLVYFINPYEKYGLPGFHVIMIVNVLLFVYSCRYFINSIIKDETVRQSYLLSALVLTFCLYCTNGDKELFIWFTGACYYTVELALSMLSAGILIRMLKADKIDISKIAIASVLGFLASGGNLIVTATHCSVILIIIIMCFGQFKADKRFFIPFIVSLIGGIINALGPGNFARANESVIEGHSTVFDALSDTFLIVVKELKVLSHSTLFIVIVVAAFLIALSTKAVITDKKISGLWAILSWVASLVVIYVSFFPAGLGAHSDSLASERLHMVFYIIASFMIVFASTMTGLWARNLKDKVKLITMVAVVAVSLVILLFKGGKLDDFRNGYVTCVIDDVKSGNLRSNYIMRAHILSTFEMAEEGSDVILFMPYYECRSTYGMGVNEDPNSFGNDTIENWKNLNSVTVYYWGLTYPPKEE